MEITFLLIVATSVFELVYVNVPVLLVVGATKLNDASPNVLAATENPDKTVVILFTVKFAVVVAGKKLLVVA
jgi:hypothetical protein